MRGTTQCIQFIGKHTFLWMKEKGACRSLCSNHFYKPHAVRNKYLSIAPRAESRMSFNFCDKWWGLKAAWTTHNKPTLLRKQGQGSHSAKKAKLTCATRRSLTLFKWANLPRLLFRALWSSDALLSSIMCYKLRICNERNPLFVLRFIWYVLRTPHQGGQCKHINNVERIFVEISYWPLSLAHSAWGPFLNRRGLLFKCVSEDYNAWKRSRGKFVHLN